MAKKTAQQPVASRGSTTSSPAPVVASKPSPSKPSPAPATAPSSINTTTKPTPNQLSSRSSPQDIALHVWNRYLNDTPARILLLDVFMAFLVLNGGVQFLYCVLAGNYPFNAFLSGFCAAVGQFVLTASLRMQISERPPSAASIAAKKGVLRTVDGVTGEVIEDGKNVKISSERAFAEFVFGSLILHAFCINFIN